jgi:hypothetical protein
LNYEDGNSLLGLIEFQSKFGSFESSSINLDNMHFSVMTNFMKKMLTNTAEMNGRNIGGILTDVTHSYFRFGFCFSSSVYIQRLHRWVPVLFTWIQKQEELHHEAHFAILIKTIINSFEDESEQSHIDRSDCGFLCSSKKWIFGCLY